MCSGGNGAHISVTEAMVVWLEWKKGRMLLATPAGLHQI